MRLMLKLRINFLHLNNHVQDLQWRGWEHSNKKLSKRTRKISRRLIKKFTEKMLPHLTMNLRSFRQSQPWARPMECKLNLLKRSSSDSIHQKVFFLKLQPLPKLMTLSTFQMSSTSIPMWSITDNLFAEKFLDQLSSLQIWATKTNLSHCQLPKKTASKLIPFSDSITEKSCLLLTRTEPLSKTVKMSLTVGSLKTQWAKNYKRKSQLKLVQVRIKNSSLLLKLQRTNWPKESYLSLMSKWKSNQSSIKSNLITKAQRSLAKRRSSTVLKCYSSVISTIQELSAWNNCSTRVHNLMLFPSLLRKPQAFKGLNYHSRTWVAT